MLRVVHPDPGDPICSVLSTSFYVSNGDDSAELAREGVTTGLARTHSRRRSQDAAIQGVTFVTVSGDYGVNPSAYGGAASDGKQHVVYPGSDPWALCCGGTTIGNVVGSTFDEYVWNDPAPGQLWGATGGGVSDFFNFLPSYQVDAGVPVSLKDGHVGRGVPDVAANASYNSGYKIIIGGNPAVGNGTSAAAPLWAALIALVNAALGESVGFVNPVLYALGSSVFRDIVAPPGPIDNSDGGVAGYPAGVGWDACTGWGSPEWRRALAGSEGLLRPRDRGRSPGWAAVRHRVRPTEVPHPSRVQRRHARSDGAQRAEPRLERFQRAHATVSPVGNRARRPGRLHDRVRPDDPGCAGDGDDPDHQQRPRDAHLRRDRNGHGRDGEA